MTRKIKRRSLRCGGRPKADFGSLFTSVIAPALNAAGSIADEPIDNNKTITIPSDPTKTPTMRLGGRKKCWIGAAIGAATSIAGSLFGNGAQKREMRRQQSIRDWQNTTQEAANMTTTLNNSQDYQEDYLRQFRTAARLGKTLGAKGIYITDGGDATKIGNNTYLLRGGSHEDVNETGQTGIGINVGGNEVEAEGGEVAQKKNGALRIFSAQPILGGISPAQAVMRGANKDRVFNAQQQFKRRNHLSDDGYRAKWGIGWIDSLFGNDTPKKRIVHFYKSQATGKVFKTRQEAITENNKYKTNLGYRRTINREKEYEAAKNKSGNERIPYIKEKEIKLTNAGKLTGIKLTTNQLDSIAKYANRTGLPIKTALGLVMKETTFNNLTPYGRQIIQNENIESMPSWSWVNNHHWSYWRNPYREAIEAALRNTKNKTTKDINNQLANGEKYADKLAKDLKTQPFITGIEDGFRKYKTNPYNYNPGQKNYVQLVNQNSRDIMNSPQIQQWYKTSPYIKGRKYKCGGRISLRPKAAIGIYTPFNKRYTSIYDAPDYDSDYNGGNVLGNGEVTVTAKRIKPTFMKPNNDAMNLIKVPKEEVPYIPQKHNRSRTIFSGGDYLGLGIDTLAALSTGLVNYNTAGKYTLPDRAPIIQASKLPTTYNVNPEIEEVKRYRDRLTGQTFNNTSSSVAALNRSGAINLDALSNLSKLWATKENEENKMLTEDAKNQQTVAAQNVQNELARQSEIARIKNEATQAKGDALNVGLSGLSQAWTNFWTAGRTAYEDDQSRRAMIASSKEATPTRLSEMDFDLSPDILASLYRTAKDDRTRRFYLSRLSPKQRQKYGIN